MNLQEEKQIRKLIRETVEKIFLTEDRYYFDEIMNHAVYDIFRSIQNQEKISFNVVPKDQYHHALKEFMEHGDFIKFPTKYIYDWKELILENIAKLYYLNDINGHSSQFCWDEFYDTFDNIEYRDGDKPTFSEWVEKKNSEKEEDEEEKKINSWYSAYDYLYEVYNVEEYLPKFSNFQDVISDYGLEPLMRLGYEMADQEEPKEIIVTINKILDVSHQRSDLAEIFIEGGSVALDYISSY
ncbi:hypothetical protein MEO93_27760 [Dolichospermum sp. ST_sed3]|nr:hypothetical protein [Dolichospermum sp. ST_sed3]